MKRTEDPDWRKAKVAAGLLLRARHGTLGARERRLAGRLAAQPGVTDRLIEQALAWRQAGRRNDVSA